MRWLRQLLDSKAPLFEEGGKLEKFYPLYEAADTFFYTPGETTKGASHVRDALDLKRMMTMVVVALIPCVFMACYNTGFQANQGYEIALNKIANIAPVINAVVLQENDSENDETEANTDIFEAKRTENGRDTKLNELNQSLGWRGAIVGTPNSTSLISNLLHGATYFLPVYIVCMTIGGICEVIFAMVRGHEVNEGFLVTGLLFPLTLPPTIPLWQVAVGIAFGVVIGKEVFGGTGRNFLNPALTARAFLYFAYPAQISGDKVWNALGNVDGISGATILGDLAALPNKAAGQNLLDSFNFSQSFFGFTGGSMGETSTLCCLIGAIVLIATGIGSWRIMVSVLAGGLLTAALLNAVSGDENAAMFAMSPLQHLVVGGFAFGLVFMATDPVSAAMTDKGKYFYGTLIGVLAILIRVINPAYPEGIMLAILFGNVFAPLIDYFVVQQNIKRRTDRWAANAPAEG
ncbi:MAG: NADH:ubiquinone reductase (Na(+)-transporting) subunit B [Planctomycetaceae bacterium]|nr:NADH:ubiquinone reductase (Na(+)-transporting) subunit B [Planctomycetaceae bacterium]